MLIDPVKFMIYVKRVIPHPDNNKVSLLELPSGEIFSCQPNGSPETRPAGSAGPYEACVVNGTLATFQPEQPTGPFYTFGFASVGDLL